MSYDLVALSGVDPMDADQAADIYHHLSDGRSWDSLLHPDPNVAAFVKEITRRWPQLDDVPEDEVDMCPWSVELELSPAHAVGSMRWSRADDVGSVFIDMALKHRLNVFDPQEGVLHAPGIEPRSVSPRPRPARVCAKCGKPIGEAELTAELPGAPGIYHLQCMLRNWPPGSAN